MTPDQFETFKKIQATRPLVGVGDLWDQEERTLLTGYLVGRDWVHVYLKGDLIHRVVSTREEEILEHRALRWWDPEHLLKDQKRWYPQWSDQEFAVKLVRKGAEPVFTTYTDPGPGSELITGLVCECPMGEGHHWMA